jgi:hypothetical protein
MKKDKSKKRPPIASSPAVESVPTSRKKTGKYIPYLAFSAFLLILFSILLKPSVIDGLVPRGVDVLASIGGGHQIREFQSATGERALYNPAMFSGMPIYHRGAPVTISVDTFLKGFLGRMTDRVFIYYLFAAAGMLFLARYLKLNIWAGFAAALLFVLWPHYNALWLEGHFAKFEALMYLPWIVLSFLYFVDRKNLLGMALFALAFGNQIRTQHYQIVFYTGLLIFAIGLWPFVKMLLERQFIPFLKTTGMLVAAIVLGIMLAAQPIFLANEYLPYSKRGKTTLSLDEPQPEGMKEGQGVTMEYATQWSTHPKELATWLIPRAFGGMSGEKYSGEQYPHLKDRMVPGYWGYMPFTQSYEYMGLAVLLLAAFGLWYYRRRPLVMALGLFGLFLTLLSFGRHFQAFYSLFYDYMPYFNKFRAPMMSVTVTYFILAMLAALGLDRLLQNGKGPGTKELTKPWYWVVGIFAFLGIYIALSWPAGGFAKPGESYDPQQMEVISGIRAEFFQNDLTRFFLFLAVLSLLIFLRIRNILKPWMLGTATLLIIMMDLIPIHQRSEKEFFDREKAERREFAATSADAYILQDQSLFRIFPVGQSFGDNRWSFYHQSIGGYSPIKMVTVEELIENNLYRGWDPQFPINWNVVKIFNAKYLIIEGRVNHPELQPVHQDQANGQFVYLYRGHTDRAWFVGNTRVIPDGMERLKTLNTQEINLDSTAILEEELAESIAMPDSSYTRVLDFNPNLLSLEVFTDKQALLVISENHYPPGWKVYLNDVEVEKVYRANHSIQAIVVPDGKHRVELRFDPDSWHRNVTYARISSGILIAVILLSLLNHFRKGRGILRNRDAESQSE